VKDLYLLPLEEDDIPHVAMWLERPAVRKWFPVPHDWLAEIHGRKADFSFLHHFMAVVDGKKIGFCQYYRCSDADEAEYRCFPREGTYSIDYLIGDDEFLGCGCGRQMVQALVAAVFLLPDTQRIVVQPDKGNAASQAVLRSVGFWHDRLHQVFCLEKPVTHICQSGSSSCVPFDFSLFERRITSLYSFFCTSESVAYQTSLQEDWSLYDQVVHLIDSAAQNHQRFVRLQTETHSVFPGYDASLWRRATGFYSREPTSETDVSAYGVFPSSLPVSSESPAGYRAVVSLFLAYNLHILEIVRRIRPECLANTWDIEEKELTLEFLVNDYYAHLYWHEDLARKTVRYLTAE
jgi:RimJ/RimL family protein N-acetyltransferase